jgi:hypothetical protein
MREIDITGQHFGSLKVIGKSNRRSKQGYVLWECECKCGNIAYSTSSNLRSGRMKSCGCLRRSYFGDPKQTSAKAKTFFPEEKCMEYDKKNHCCKILTELVCEKEYYCVFCNLKGK